jgi:hypothetical protein
MSIKKTAVFSLIFLLLLGFYYFYDIKHEKQVETKKEEEKKVFSSLKKDDIVRLRIIRKDAPISFSREGGLWFMTEPERILAKSSDLDSLLPQLADLKREETVEEKPKDYKKFGLAQPVIRIEIEAGTNPSRVYTLFVGKKNPTGSMLYAREKDRDPIFLITSTPSAYLERKPDDFREKEAISLEFEDLADLRVSTGTVKFGILKGPEFWKFSTPPHARVDEDSVRTWYYDLKSIQAESFLSPAKAADLFKSPAARITMKFKDFDKPVALVAAAKEAKQFLVRRSIDGAAFTVKAQDFKKLFKKGDDFVDRHVAYIRQVDVKKMEVLLPKGKVTAEKDKDGWKYTAPEKKKDEEWKLDSLVNRLQELKYEKKIESATKQEEYGLDRDFIEIVLYNEKGEKAATFHFAKSDPKAAVRYVRSDKAGEVYAVKENLYKTVQDDFSGLFKKPSPVTPASPAAPGATTPAGSASPGATTPASPAAPGAATPNATQGADKK